MAGSRGALLWRGHEVRTVSWQGTESRSCEVVMKCGLSHGREQSRALVTWARAWSFSTRRTVSLWELTALHAVRTHAVFHSFVLDPTSKCWVLLEITAQVEHRVHGSLCSGRSDSVAAIGKRTWELWIDFTLLISRSLYLWYLEQRYQRR